MNVVILSSLALMCMNNTIACIVSSTGVLLSICNVKKGKDIAITSGVIYIITNIVYHSVF